MDMKTWVASKGLQQACKCIGKDPETNIPKLMELVDKFAGDSYQSQRDAIRKVVNDPDSNWFRLICSLWEDVDSEVLRRLFSNFIINANFYGWDIQEKARQKYGCNIPWAILMDPTSACNLHCTGCWAAEYGNKLNLSLDELDSVICQGKELGTYMYIYSGGEPLVRKDDIIRLCEKHDDCVFLAFTNATLIDEAFADEMLRVKNFVPAISVEGFEEDTDFRRGEGTFGKVMRAMEILRRKKLPFGVSCCYTGKNVETISSEKYFEPDVILVGEMRDLDTIQVALEAAETGHLVFSTLHTIGAAPTIDRIIDVFPPEQQQQTRIQLAEVLEAVISQQLMPVVGGRGRVAAFEVMLANPAIKNLIREAKSHQIPSMIQTNKKLGMQLMDDAIFDLYLKRKIDADHALSYAVDPSSLEKRMF